MQLILCYDNINLNKKKCNNELFVTVIQTTGPHGINNNLGDLHAFSELCVTRSDYIYIYQHNYIYIYMLIGVL